MLAIFAVAGCGDDDDDGGGGGGGGETIKVGASLPLTGEFSEPGKAAQQGYKVWEALGEDATRTGRVPTEELPDRELKMHGVRPQGRSVRWR